eukprot:8525148-Alexandrium_andersonii.AAC.1
MAADRRVLQSMPSLTHGDVRTRLLSAWFLAQAAPGSGENVEWPLSLRAFSDPLLQAEQFLRVGHFRRIAEHVATCAACSQKV